MEVIAIRLEAIATSNKKLTRTVRDRTRTERGAPGLTTSSNQGPHMAHPKPGFPARKTHIVFVCENPVVFHGFRGLEEAY